MNGSGSLWLDAPYTPRAPLAGAKTCEVCVVGAGIAGISAAWHLAERGARVTVLEAETVAGGATGRNGGFFIAGVAPAYDESRRLWGREPARRRHQATLAGQRRMLDLAAAAGAAQDFRITGVLRLAMDGAEAEAVRAQHTALVEDGFGAELVAEALLPPALRGEGRLGLLTRGDGSVQPAGWLRALARAAESRGVRIHEGSRVAVPPSLDGEGVRVDTARGRLAADRVVIAADGALASLLPAAASVRPRRLNMLATAPWPERVLPVPVYARYGFGVHAAAARRPRHAGRLLRPGRSGGLDRSGGGLGTGPRSGWTPTSGRSSASGRR